MKYQFKLQSLLKYRTFLKEKTQLEVAMILGNIQTLNQKRRKLIVDMEKILEKLQFLLAEGIPASEYQISMSYVNDLKNQVRKVEQKIEKSNNDLEISRKKLVDRMLEVKKLERLSEKEFDCFKKSQKTKEMKSNDETYSIHFSTKNQYSIESGH